MLATYYMLDKHLGRSERIASYSMSEMRSYLMIKRHTLKQMFVCVYLLKE